MMRGLAIFCAGVCVLGLVSGQCVPGAQDLSDLRALTDDLRAKVSENPSPRGCPMKGARGIVMTVGTQSHLDNAWVSLDTLRNSVNSTLPVTIMHWGDEVTAGVVDHLEAKFEGVTFVDIQQLEETTQLPMPHTCNHGEKPHGWMLKALALYHAKSFYEHVLMLDVDNFVLTDPVSLFDTPEYIESGNMFWPDFFGGWVNEEIYDVLTHGAYEATSNANTESGQILMNTCKHGDVLEFVRTLNENHPVTYNYMFGDKDTFRLSFALADKLDQFYQVPTQPSGAYTTLEGSKELQRIHMEDLIMNDGEAVDMEEWSQCRQSVSPALLVAMVASGPTGDLQFLHRTNAEFSIRNQQQIKAEFLISPQSPRQAKSLMWSAPGQGWAICPEDAVPMMTPPQIEMVEQTAEASLNELRMDIGLGNMVGYSEMSQGVRAEVVRAMQVRRVGTGASNATNSSTAAPTSPPTSAPTSTTPTSAPTYETTTYVLKATIQMSGVTTSDWNDAAILAFQIVFVNKYSALGVTITSSDVVITSAVNFRRTGLEVGFTVHTGSTTDYTSSISSWLSQSGSSGFASQISAQSNGAFAPSGVTVTAIGACTGGAGCTVTPASSPSSSGGLSGGAIAGIVIGCIVGVAVIVVVIYFVAFRGHSQDTSSVSIHKNDKGDESLSEAKSTAVVSGPPQMGDDNNRVINDRTMQL